jgi:hypothetical protein
LHSPSRTPLQPAAARDRHGPLRNREGGLFVSRSPSRSWRLGGSAFCTPPALFAAAGGAGDVTECYQMQPFAFFRPGVLRSLRVLRATPQPSSRVHAVLRALRGLLFPFLLLLHSALRIPHSAFPRPLFPSHHSPQPLTSSVKQNGTT